jgi:hypothetical protein
LESLQKLPDFTAAVLEKKRAEASQWRKTLLESKTLQSKGFCTDVSGAARADAFQTLGV